MSALSWASACLSWATDLCATRPGEAWLWLALVVCPLIASIDLVAPHFASSVLVRFEEWRAGLGVRAGAPPPRDRTAQLLDLAVAEAAASFAPEAAAPPPARRAQKPCAGALAEEDWLAMLRRRDGAGAPGELDAFASGHCSAAIDRMQRTIARLLQQSFHKAAAIYACRAALCADAAQQPKAAAAFARDALTLAEQTGSAPARAAAGALLARCALQEGDLAEARAHIARASEAGEDCAPAILIALADVRAELQQRAGNFERARALLAVRRDLERRLARRPRDFRIVDAHHLADLARVELVEAFRLTGKSARGSGRRAERLLRESLAAFRARRDVCALSLAYTRLAMAAVLQHKLARARAFALRGRRFAETLRALDLIDAADDLVRRIDAQRTRERWWTGPATWLGV